MTQRHAININFLLFISPLTYAPTINRQLLITFFLAKKKDNVPYILVDVADFACCGIIVISSLILRGLVVDSGFDGELDLFLSITRLATTLWAE